MLSFAEEILLLSLDDQGTIRQLSAVSLDYALAGAVLTDLALLNRIDTDLESLFVVDSTPTGDTFFDSVLGEIHSDVNRWPAMHWLDHFSRQGARIQELVLNRLIEKQILKKENRKILWVFEVRRYPIIDNSEPRAVKTRLRELILSDDIPDPHDAVLISLANGCGLFTEIFTNSELDSVRARIENLARLDLVGREIVRAITTIEKAVFMTSIPPV
ncbi:MAG: GPP34 family phosphoprotein [Syntrophobacteraceae bacterium]|nr:GPP34 family phosphoprotein [Syntrophobacteraceae bacterium]